MTGARNPNEAGRFEGRVAVVTGGARGIGAATVRRLVAEGARVAVSDLDEAPGTALAKECGDAAFFQRADVREPADLEALCAATVERFGRIDVLVNNAGIGAYGRAPDLDPAVWRNVVAVDLDSVFYGCRAAIPIMRESGGGAIVNTASISGLFGDHGLLAYNAAKGGVVNLTRTLALDHAEDGIRVNAVCPGPVDTPLARALIEHEGIRADYAERIPMGRVGRPEEIASAIAFLASDDAAYVTGVMLVVDGGLTAGTGQPHFRRHLGAG